MGLEEVLVSKLMEGRLKDELDGMGDNLGAAAVADEGFDEEATKEASEFVFDSVVQGLFFPTAAITSAASSLISSRVSPLELLDFSGVAIGALGSS